MKLQSKSTVLDFPSVDYVRLWLDNKKIQKRSRAINRLTSFWDLYIDPGGPGGIPECSESIQELNQTKCFYYLILLNNFQMILFILLYFGCHGGFTCSKPNEAVEVFGFQEGCLRHQLEGGV